MTSEIDRNFSVTESDAVCMHNETMFDCSEYTARPLDDLEITHDIYNVSVPKSAVARMHKESIFDCSQYANNSLANLKVTSDIDLSTNVSRNNIVDVYNETQTITNNAFLPDRTHFFGGTTNAIDYNDTSVVLYEADTIQNNDFSQVVPHAAVFDVNGSFDDWLYNTMPIS